LRRVRLERRRCREFAPQTQDALNGAMKYRWLLVLALSAPACSSPSGGDAGDVASDHVTDDALSGDGSAVLDADGASDGAIDAPPTDTFADDVAVDAPEDTAAEASADANTDAPLVDVPMDGLGPSTLCVVSGGTVAMGRCCASTGDFPSSCTTGACGCSPSSSHNVMTCICPSGQCYDPTLGCRTGP
jgi:hypothetical protein